ncbi:MAG: relaxase MobL [Anaerorhabdus sp.]
MADIVNMMMFVEYGKPFPTKLKIKGEVNSDSLLGYGSYTARQDSRNDIQEEIGKSELEFIDGYLGYTSRTSSRGDDEVEIKTFTNGGWISDKDERENFKRSIQQFFSKEGDLAWLPVTSFKDYFTAEQYGLLNDEDYAAVFQKVLPKFFQRVGMDPKNMIWWFDVHTDKSHPHTHLVFLEKEKTRRKGTFKPKDLEYFKGLIINEADKRMNAIKGISVDKNELFKNKDILRSDLKETMIDAIAQNLDNSISNKIERLFISIDRSTVGGRLQYGSSNMRSFRTRIDSITEDILRHPQIEKKAKEFKGLLQEFDKLTQNKLNSKYSNFEDVEMKKLKKEIGNYILSLKKDWDLSKVNTVDKAIKNKKSYKKNKHRVAALEFSLGQLTKRVSWMKKAQIQQDIDNFYNREEDQFGY